ncbi:conserved hypothetical protein, secreted [Candidatus Magnetomorum sp. HK-1]|nr:conserved hypothetical protein, secreted [Candidatus Magnetomorum sp. HK-1]
MKNFLFKSIFMACLIFGLIVPFDCLAKSEIVDLISKALNTVEVTIINGPQNQILINKGSDNGIKKGDLFTIYNFNSEIKDSKESLGFFPEMVSIGKIIKTEKRFAELFVKDQQTEIKPGFIARRYDDINAYFIDNDGGNHILYEKISSNLFRLNWQPYTTKMNLKPKDFELTLIASNNNITVKSNNVIMGVYENDFESIARFKNKLVNLTNDSDDTGYTPIAIYDEPVFNMNIVDLSNNDSRCILYHSSNAVCAEIGKNKKRLCYKYEGFGKLVNVSFGANNYFVMNIIVKTEKMISRLLKFENNSFVIIAKDIDYILSFADLDGNGNKTSIIGQSFDSDSFFGQGIYLFSIKGDQLVIDRSLDLPNSFTIIGSLWCDIDGNNIQETLFYNKSLYIEISEGKKQKWISPDKFGGATRSIQFDKEDIEISPPETLYIWGESAMMILNSKKLIYIPNSPARSGILGNFGGLSKNGKIILVQKKKSDYAMNQLSLNFNSPVQNLFEYRNHLYGVLTKRNFFSNSSQSQIVLINLSRIKY